MKDLYKVKILEKHIKTKAEDKYYLVQVKGTAGNPFNLDKNALLLLKEYYEGKYTFPMKSAEEIIASRNESNFVEGYIEIDISTLFDNDYEGFLDIISEELVGSVLLTDIDYEIVGVKDDNMLILRVAGDVSNIIREEVE